MVGSILTVTSPVILEMLDPVVTFAERLKVAENSASTTFELRDVVNVGGTGLGCAPWELAVFIPDSEHSSHGFGDSVTLRGAIQRLVGDWIY